MRRIVLALPASLLLVATTVASPRPAAAASNSNVHIVNLSDRNFAVSFFTDTALSGASIQFGLTCANSTISSPPESETDGYAHLIDAGGGLSAFTTYYYVIVENGQVDDNGGACYSVTTAQSGSPGTPDTATGYVKYGGACTIGAQSAIVELTITRGGVTSLPMAAMSFTGGGWSIVFGAARLPNGTNMNPRPPATITAFAAASTSNKSPSVSKAWDGSGQQQMPDLCLHGAPPASPTSTPTSTVTPTATATDTPTGTPATDTLTPTGTPPTATDIPTDTPTVTDTPVGTPTDTPTDVPTDTPTDTPLPDFVTATDTPGPTPRGTRTVTPTGAPRPMSTSTSIAVPSGTPLIADTPAPTPTDTPTVPAGPIRVHIQAVLSRNTVRRGDRVTIFVSTDAGAHIHLVVTYADNSQPYEGNGYAPNGAWARHWRVRAHRAGNAVAHLTVTYLGKKRNYGVKFRVV